MYHLDPMEGGQSKVSNIKANFFAQINDKTGVMVQPESLMKRNFTDAGLVLKNLAILRSVPIGAYFNAIADGGEKGFFRGTAKVEVMFMSRKDETVPKFLKPMRIVSDIYIIFEHIFMLSFCAQYFGR